MLYFSPALSKLFLYVGNLVSARSLNRFESATENLSLYEVSICVRSFRVSSCFACFINLLAYVESVPSSCLGKAREMGLFCTIENAIPTPGCMCRLTEYSIELTIA